MLSSRTSPPIMLVGLTLLLALVVAGCDSSDATVTTDTSELYPVSVDGKWGFIDNTGTIKVEPQC